MFIVKNYWGDPCPRWDVRYQASVFSSARKNLSRQRPLGAEMWSSENVDFGGSESVCITVLLVDQSSPHFFRRTRESHVFPILDISIRSGDIRDRTLKWFEIEPNFARYWPSKFWDLIYHAEEPSFR